MNVFTSPFNTQTIHIKALNTQQHCCFPKNLIPGVDSNPGLLAPEADAMSTAPRRRGTKKQHFFRHDPNSPFLCIPLQALINLIRARGFKTKLCLFFGLEEEAT
jgi:hypothetical protein